MEGRTVTLRRGMLSRQGTMLQLQRCQLPRTCAALPSRDTTRSQVLSLSVKDAMVLRSVHSTKKRWRGTRAAIAAACPKGKGGAREGKAG